MSDQQVPPTGPSGAAGQQAGQPSEEEIRAYLAQLRQADASEIVAQAFNVLASGAQVKLGRADGRLLIDLSQALHEAAEGEVDERLTTQMGDALSQLRTAQVEAEGELSRRGADEASDTGAPGSGTPQESQQADQRGGAQGQGSQTSGLWTPGG